MARRRALAKARRGHLPVAISTRLVLQIRAMFLDKFRFSDFLFFFFMVTRCCVPSSDYIPCDTSRNRCVPHGSIDILLIATIMAMDVYDGGQMGRD